MEQNQTSVVPQDNNIRISELRTPNGGFVYEIGLSQNLEIQGVTIGEDKIISADRIDFGSQKIQNVANGVEDTDAINLGQLKSVKELLSAEITTNSQKRTSVVSQDNNIRISELRTHDGGFVYETALSQNLEIQGITIGENKIISADRIDFGGQKIQNVANGSEDTDAINLGQLKNVKELLIAEITTNSQNGKPQRLNLQPTHYQGIRAFFDLGNSEVISVVNCIDWEVDFNNNQLIIHGYSSENTKIIGVNYKIN